VKRCHSLDGDVGFGCSEDRERAVRRAVAKINVQASGQLEGISDAQRGRQLADGGEAPGGRARCLLDGEWRSAGCRTVYRTAKRWSSSQSD
jgi:hypothetical protein